MILVEKLEISLIRLDYRNVFDVELSQDSKAANRWHTNKQGMYVAAGVGTPVTGRVQIYYSLMTHLKTVKMPIANYKGSAFGIGTRQQLIHG